MSSTLPTEYVYKRIKLLYINYEVIIGWCDLMDSRGLTVDVKYNTDIANTIYISLL